MPTLTIVLLVLYLGLKVQFVETKTRGHTIKTISMLLLDDAGKDYGLMGSVVFNATANAHQSDGNENSC